MNSATDAHFQPTMSGPNLLEVSAAPRVLDYAWTGLPVVCIALDWIGQRFVRETDEDECALVCRARSVGVVCPRPGHQH